MTDQPFRLEADYQPAGDQPAAIEALVEGLEGGLKHQTLLGVTGSGKTYTIANLIARTARPTLVIAHNKTLAAQLYDEFANFFPDNAVEYFVSYYDYYQPEAYIATTDKYIEKDAATNDDLDRLRHSATMALFERRDIIIIASVSCIYGLGAPEFYKTMRVSIEKGMRLDRDKLLNDLVAIQYARNNFGSERGSFRVNGDLVQIMPIYENASRIDIDFFGEEICSIRRSDAMTGRKQEELDRINIYPASHYAVTKSRLTEALGAIEKELAERIKFFRASGKLIEEQRIRERVLYDIEMIKATGYCKGIENYSRYLSGRAPGQPPPTLLEYLPDEALIVIDESHQTIPQIGAMLRGDQARKRSLVDHGFRLPSAFDNRPLSFEEFERFARRVVYVSATPARYEIDRSGARVVEQVVRPTGLIDPEVIIRPTEGQVDDLFAVAREAIERKEKILVTALTKKQAEDLTEYYQDLKLRCRYLHSEVKTLERIAIIEDLRADRFDMLIGINLLREGLDIPEVAVVAILSADVEGFLRSETSLIQTAGRAARNINGRVILYADKITGSIERAVAEMSRRRDKQIAHNERFRIEPRMIKKNLPKERLSFIVERASIDGASKGKKPRHGVEESLSKDALLAHISAKRIEMERLAKALEFESAARLRDEIFELERLALL